MKRLFNALLSWAHRKHKSTMRKIETAHPKPKNDSDRQISEALDILASYIEGNSGSFWAFCDPVTGEWKANIKDFHGRFRMKAKAATPLELIDAFVKKIVQRQKEQRT